MEKLQNLEEKLQNLEEDLQKMQDKIMELHKLSSAILLDYWELQEKLEEIR